MTRKTYRLGLVAAALLGCGPAPLGETEPGSTGSTDSTDSTDSGSTGSAGSTDSPTSSTGSSSSISSATTTDASSEDATGESTGESTGEEVITGSTGGTDEGSSTGPDMGGEPCSPPDEPTVEAFWEVRFLDAPVPTDFSGPCTVTAATPKPGGLVAAFACIVDGAPAQVEVEFARAPELTPPGVSPGAVFLLTYSEEMSWSTNRWFTLRDKGTLLLAGIQGDGIVPPGTTAQEFFGMSITLEKGLCEQVRDDCGPIERVALAVDPFVGPVLVFDGQYREIVNLGGSVVVWVEKLAFQEAPICIDTPEVQAQVLLQAYFGS